MKQEQIQKLIDDLSNNGENVNFIVVCRNDDYSMVGDAFSAEMVVGQLHRAAFQIMQSVDDPDFLYNHTIQEHEVIEMPAYLKEGHGH